MKIVKIALFLILTLTIQTQVLAETWNEPWQKEIIKKADYFVLAKVLSNVDSIGAEIEIIKYFGNQKLTGKILINGFSSGSFSFVILVLDNATKSYTRPLCVS